MLALVEIIEYSLNGYRVAPEKRFPDRLTHSIQGIQLQEVVMIIYKATNLTNGKVYIGKTIKSFKRRISQHKADFLNIRTNYYFYRALRKHGWNNFKWEIIDTTNNEQELNILEQLYIEEYRLKGKVYNLTDGGDGMSGYKPSKESRQKMSEAHKGQIPWIKGKHSTEETKKKISVAKQGNKNCLGKKHSAETRKKISEAKKGKPSPCGNEGKKHSDETKQKMSIAHSGKNNGMYGRYHTEDTKQKMSEARKAAWAKRKGTGA